MDIDNIEDWDLENMSPEEFINRILRAKTDVNDPEQTTHILFALTEYQQMRLFIYRMITAAYSKDIWEDGTGADFIYTFRLLEMGIHIAYRMNRDRLNNHDVFPYIPPPKSHSKFEPSTDFMMRNIPPMVTLHEMSAPQVTMRNFFKFLSLDDWKIVLREIRHCALSHKDYRDLGYPYPSLLIFTHLSKLIDALHIVYMGFRHM